MNKLSVFLPITKIDAAQRLVYGIATAEQKDRSGEICDYETTKPLYEKWSGEVEKASGGKSLGNVRAMHGKTAVGKVTSIAFNDTEKQIEICAKVVDDNEWEKVEQGVYTGFSQGGRYAKRWTDPTDPTTFRYTAEPSEVSLVDLPCLPSATFQYIKADGATELRKFHPAEPKAAAEPSHNDIAEKAQELAKAAGKSDEWIDFLDAGREALTKGAAETPAELIVDGSISAEKIATTELNVGILEAGKIPPGAITKAQPAAVITGTSVTGGDLAVAALAKADEPEFEQVFVCKRDGSQHPTAEAVQAHIAGLDAAEAVQKAARPALEAIDGINKALGIDPAAAAAAEDKPAATEDVAKEKPVSDLRKGLYSCARLANLLEELHWLQESAKGEAEHEGDGSAVPGQLKQACADLGAALIAMTTEEVAELIGKNDEAAVMAMCADVREGDTDALVKFVASQDTLAKCVPVIEKVGARNSKKDAGSLQKAHDALVSAGATCAAAKAAEPGDLEKALQHSETLQKALDLVTGQVTEVLSRVAAMEKRTMPLKTAGAFAAPVSKAEDAAGAAADSAKLSENDLAKALAALTPDEQAHLLTKAALAKPVLITR